MPYSRVKLEIGTTGTIRLENESAWAEMERLFRRSELACRYGGDLVLHRDCRNLRIILKVNYVGGVA